MTTVKNNFSFSMRLVMTVVIGSWFFLLMPILAYAQTTASSDQACKINYDGTNPDKYVHLQVQIPGVTDPQGNVKDLPCYIAGIYKYLAGIAGILAVVMMMYGGIRYTISFGNPQSIASAKDTITSAMLGLALVLGTYVILNFINPNLTSLSLSNLDKIAQKTDIAIWCNASNGDKPDKAGQQNCGDTGTTPDTKQCIWPGQCTTEQVCAEIGVGYKCYKPEEVCDNAQAGECEKINGALLGQGFNHACKDNSLAKLGQGAACAYTSPLVCGQDYVQVSCNLGGNSVCWNRDLNKPVSDVFNSQTRQCVDGQAWNGFDIICCAKATAINCQKECSTVPSSATEGNQAEVNCADYNKTCPIATPKCCVAVYLQHSNY